MTRQIPTTESKERIKAAVVVWRNRAADELLRLEAEIKTLAEDIVCLNDLILMLDGE